MTLCTPRENTRVEMLIASARVDIPPESNSIRGVTMLSLALSAITATLSTTLLSTVLATLLSPLALLGGL
jgi:hypothetical protein